MDIVNITVYKSKNYNLVRSSAGYCPGYKKFIIISFIIKFIIIQDLFALDKTTSLFAPEHDQMYKLNVPFHVPYYSVEIRLKWQIVEKIFHSLKLDRTAIFVHRR